MILGLSLFCGGSLSNLLDRVALGGVVDFINIAWGGLRPYIFNVADIAISTGGILALLSLAGNFARMFFNRSVEQNRR